MANALHTAESSETLKSHPKLTFKQDRFSYEIVREGKQSWYKVTDGKQEIRLPIAWAFGLGSAGQTYLLNRNGVWYESRVSFYRDTANLDLTTGARPDVPASLEEAMGRELSQKGAEECFNCHASNAMVDGALRVDQLTPGIQCQRCHTGTEAHLASFQTNSARKTTPPRLSEMTAEDMSEFCGQCHRTWSTIATNGPHNITNVRFQPYRLTNSKCYDVTDSRIRCAACHDVHGEVQHVAAVYDAKCQSCHAAKAAKAGAKLCPVQQKDCVSCHMPKVRIPETHNAFTDHWIRIARSNDPYPN